ncbi:hypothetical protein H7I41_04860 [Mycobacterium manitobense]|uniref:Uncharacterized protein n=1 Tax=[Mycobacterium] manitobense TaxID=190147 RepID=A0A9X2YKS2_9MYCO|nr:hypothetical protein [[Mycobacterium] manitobense]MCV7169255.1 hypothetical protein [[Mycobacterium] manitobense]
MAVATAGCAETQAIDMSPAQQDASLRTQLTTPDEVHRWFTTVAGLTCAGDILVFALCTASDTSQWHLKWASAGDGDAALLSSDCATGRVQDGGRAISDGKAWTLRPTRDDQAVAAFGDELYRRGLQEVHASSYCATGRLPHKMQVAPNAVEVAGGCLDVRDAESNDGEWAYVITAKSHK